MRKKIQNLIKGWITSTIGVIIMLITILKLFIGDIGFVWEGIAGLCLGTILLMAPITIEKAIHEAIQAWGKRGTIDNSESSINPDNPDK